MSDPVNKNILIATQFTGSAAMLAGVEEVLRDVSAPVLYSEDGSSLYTLLRTEWGDVIRKRIPLATKQYPYETLRIRWSTVADMDEASCVAYAKDGVFLDPDTRCVSLTHTNPWPPPVIREPARAALEELFARLGSVPGMEGVSFSVQQGQSEMGAVVSNGLPPRAPPPTNEEALSMRSIYFDRLLAAVE